MTWVNLSSMDKTAPYYRRFFAPDEARGTLTGLALDIWAVGRGKVMSIRWTLDGSTPELISFKRGPWEALLAPQTAA